MTKRVVNRGGNLIEINEQGGEGSYLAYNWDLIPPEALREVAHVFHYGAAKYSPDNWRQVYVSDHVNHALNHINRFQVMEAPNTHEVAAAEALEELSHAATRILMAMSVFMDELNMDPLHQHTPYTKERITNESGIPEDSDDLQER